MKCLAVMLFHDDEDLVEDQIKYMLQNNHEIIIFDHCSTDSTRDIILQNLEHIKDFYPIGPDITFHDNGVFNFISEILISDYANNYDWISFIESDEFLEGPDRTMSYYEHLVKINGTQYNWIKFDNYVFWFTEKDDPTIKSPRERIKYYAYKKECGTRVYAWRGKFTNIRYYNHNPPKNQTEASCFPMAFKTCHYEMRSIGQAMKKLEDRVKIIEEQILDNQDEEGFIKKIPCNLHYKIMHDLGPHALIINSDDLHYDDGSELIQDNKNDFSSIYNNDIMKTLNKQLQGPHYIEEIPPKKKGHLAKNIRKKVTRKNKLKPIPKNPLSRGTPAAKASAMRRKAIARETITKNHVRIRKPVLMKTNQIDRTITSEDVPKKRRRKPKYNRGRHTPRKKKLTNGYNIT